LLILALLSIELLVTLFLSFYILPLHFINLDLFQVAVSIIEDYIILGGTEFLNMHASSVAKILDLVVGNVNDKGIISTLPVIDILIQVLGLSICKCRFLG
jgi:hypothetical protein